MANFAYMSGTGNDFIVGKYEGIFTCGKTYLDSSSIKLSIFLINLLLFNSISGIGISLNS